MNLEMSRIYRDLIEEVMLKLENEGDSEGISRSTIFEVQSGWSQRLRAYSEINNEPMYENARYHGYASYEGRRSSPLTYRDNKEESQEEDLNDKVISDSDSEDYEMLEGKNKNFLMCLYVRVHKTRNKWKCSFKQGFVNIGNIDYAFSNAQGELEW